MGLKKTFLHFKSPRKSSGTIGRLRGFVANWVIGMNGILALLTLVAMFIYYLGDLKTAADFAWKIYLLSVALSGLPVLAAYLMEDLSYLNQAVTASCFYGCILGAIAALGVLVANLFFLSRGINLNPSQLTAPIAAAGVLGAAVSVAFEIARWQRLRRTS